ncbi:MAG TPA: 3-phenylpropionate MFS transporter [Magnetospirillum sp.]|nr:3-phenylpropionate MFS transporter [Magnetospirillum sp.]
MTAQGAAVRLAIYYSALFMAVGIHLPFWPLWLKDKGLTAAQIGIIVAATYLVKSVVNPLVGHVVDRRGDRRLPMLCLAAGAALAWVGFAGVSDFWPILLLTMVALGFWSGIMPVGEALALMTTQQHGIDYGRVRLWGSAAFILTAIGCGRLLVGHSPDILVWLIAATLALTTLACATLPDTRVPVSEGAGVLPLRPLVTSAAFLLFLAAGSLNSAAHTVYYAFSTIHWKAAGISDDTIGLLWSEGVVCEILLFSLSGRVVGRLGPTGLLVLAGLGGLLRWTVLGLSTNLPLLAAAQVLHAATFGCAHLGAMHFIQRAVPAGLSARAQGIYSAVAMGVAPGLMSPLTGRLYDAYSGHAFLVMAGLSALAALAAARLHALRRL